MYHCWATPLSRSALYAALLSAVSLCRLLRLRCDATGSARERAVLLESDEYYRLREHLIAFLAGQELRRGLLEDAA